jgi:DNA-binding MarR family transcriptional regulator
VASSFDKSIDAVAETCLAVQIRMLNRVVTNIYDEELRPLGLKVSQMNILVAAYKIGNARPSDVCERLHLDVSTLSRNVDRMMAKGWLEVVQDADGRAQPFRLTDSGRELLQKTVPRWKAAQKRAAQLLGDEVVEVVNTAVRRLQRSRAAV